MSDNEDNFIQRNPNPNPYALFDLPSNLHSEPLYNTRKGIQQVRSIGPPISLRGGQSGSSHGRTGATSTTSESTFLGVSKSNIRWGESSTRGDHDELHPQPNSLPDMEREGMRPLALATIGENMPEILPAYSYSPEVPPLVYSNEAWTPAGLGQGQDAFPETPGSCSEVLSFVDGASDGVIDDGNHSVVLSRKGFRCDVPNCPRQWPFGSNADLLRHKSTVHKEGTHGRTEYICAAPSCYNTGKLKVWPRKDNFKTHCKARHPEEDLDDLLRRSEQLAAQTGPQRSSSAELPHEPRCYQCRGFETDGRVFTRETDLRRHIQTVHGERRQRFDCLVPRCTRRGDKGFRRKDHWRVHLRNSHHVQTLTCPYGPDCRNVFDLAEYPHAYAKHVKIHHNEEPPTRQPLLSKPEMNFEFHNYQSFDPATLRNA